MNPTFAVPLGEHLVHTEPAVLRTRGSQVAGTLFVTDQRFAFRGDQTAVTCPLAHLQSVGVHVPRRLWVLRGQPLLRLHPSGPLGVVDLEVPAPEQTLAHIEKAKADVSPRPDARSRLAHALTTGVRDPARYTDTLSELAFPGGFWHPEDGDALLAELLADVTRLELPLDTATVHRLARDIPTSAAGDEDTERAGQIEALATRINALLPDSSSRRLRAYACTEDWDDTGPMWLWLDASEHEALTELGVLTPA